MTSPPPQDWLTRLMGTLRSYVSSNPRPQTSRASEPQARQQASRHEERKQQPHDLTLDEFEQLADQFVIPGRQQETKLVRSYSPAVVRDAPPDQGEEVEEEKTVHAPEQEEKSGSSLAQPRCGAFCGEDLDFESGAGEKAVMRCPDGNSAQHRATGPFFHRDCLVSPGGLCGGCRFPISDDRYWVKKPSIPTTKPPEVWADRTAARWQAAFVQEQEGQLCYATSASAVWQAFGHPAKTPRECAHDFAYSHFGEGRFADYKREYDGLRFTYPGWTVRQRQARMSQDAIEELTYTQGEPILTGIGVSTTRRNTIAFAAPGGSQDRVNIRGAVDDNKLIMAGSNNHWVVVFGYGTSDRGGQRVDYFDPIDGSARQESYGAFISEFGEECIVVG
ncbi:hypothetical protein [Streptomyces sp. NPDC047028]|uniref:hypothetical protein n=1 Tax=Streptomyces sp. NPDC047028 TaxID=3155793 RepID=UPI00340864A5